MPDGWEFASEPSVVVGTDLSEFDAMLDVVRDAVRLSDGRILVANGGLSSRLPVFSSEGRYLTSFGGLGDGPGEFRWITGLETGSNDSVFGADGALVSTFEGPGALRPVTDEHLQTREAVLLAGVPEHERAWIRSRFRAEARTTHLPFYFAMVADEWGQIWLQEYSPPWGMGPRWYVLSQSGDRLARVEMPKVLTVFSITREGVLGGFRGEFGEETVELFPLIRRPSEMADPLPECVVS